MIIYLTRKIMQIQRKVGRLNTVDAKRLAGKNILITGAARGMGATNAEHFAELVANVCIGDIDEDLARKVAE